jgi:hypothetical protein
MIMPLYFGVIPNKATLQIGGFVVLLGTVAFNINMKLDNLIFYTILPIG